MVYAIAVTSLPKIMKILHRLALMVGFGMAVASVSASDDPLFHSQDPLAPRDEWGVLRIRRHPVAVRSARLRRQSPG